MTQPRALRPRSGSSAKAVLLTVLGELVLRAGGAAWTSTVVAVLASQGVEEKNARQALARLAEQGLVAATRRGRRARWHLTSEGTALLQAGTQRIYRFGAGGDEWDGRWLVVLASVPEDQRARRHQLRARLGFAGFGSLAPGVALTPHVEREAAANAVLKELGLADVAVVLRAEAGELSPAGELLHRAWDLDDLAARYQAFLDRFGGRAPVDAADRLGALVELVHEWRRFPFVDPEIPARLLPPTWPGRKAKQLFDRCHESWAPDARRCFAELEQRP